MSINFNHLYYRSKECIAQGAGTNSKRPQSLVEGFSPTHFSRVHMNTGYTPEGVSYTDYICSLGANLFGMGHPKILQAIIEAYNRGSIYSVGSPYEVQAAERLKGILPWVDRVKWLKTGTEACMASVKIARAATGRSPIIVEGYHGHSDMFIDTPPALGVDPKATERTLRGVDKHRHLLDKCAAVIIEPVELDASEARKEWLRTLREDCTKTGTMLIFDEVITGFRWPDYTVSKNWGIIPDILCLGKAIGGGLPLSCVVGKREVMECDEYFVSSTFSGDNLALASFLAVCDLLNTVEYSFENLWSEGRKFIDGFNSLHPDLRIEGYPSRGAFKGDLLVRDLFFQETAIAGLLFGPSFFFNFPLTYHTDQTISICRDILTNIKEGRVEMVGKRPLSPFASSQRS